ncbi:armadillo-type protein [Pisolithus croceorrhizus]|nr:armadillo-type protein [Pisolithus croceorrhizus]
MDGPQPQEEDFTSLPISERLAHKNWKARVSAYETLIKAFQTSASDNDPVFKPYISNPDLLKKIVTDSNAVAQEKGVECLVALTRDTVVPALGSVQRIQAIELILQYVEVENTAAGVVASLRNSRRLSQASVLALKEVVRVLYRSYQCPALGILGTQVTPLAPVLKTRMFVLRGTQLVHTIYRYIGPSIDPFLAELKPVQVKELQEAFEAMEKEGNGKGSLKGRALISPDPRLLTDPVNIVSKFPSNMQASLASSKWKERKEVLDELLTLDTPEISDLSKSLAVCIQKDANVNCVVTAANVLEGLARGVMEPFGKLREALVLPILERLKERKASVTDAIGAALDAIFLTTSLPDIIPDLLPSLSNKNPQVKEGTLKFLARCLSTSSTPIQSGQIKMLTEPLSILLEDSFEGARNEAATCLGTLMKMVGERPLNAVMEGLADVRKSKVREAYEKATVKCKTGAGGGPPKAPPPAKEAAKKKVTSKSAVSEGITSSAIATDVPIGDPPLDKPKGKPPAKLMDSSGGSGPSSAPKSAPPVSKKPPVASAATPKGGKPAAPSALDTFKYKHTPEDAEGLVAELIPASIMEGLGDANWKTRLAACEEMTTWLQGVVTEVDAEVVVRAIAKKGWNEKNFQVSAKLYAILTSLAESCPSFGRSCVALSSGHLSEKLGDMKLKKPAGDALTVFAEKTSLQFVLNQIYEPLGKQKAPKVLADSLGWIDTAISEFGIAGLSLRTLVEFLKTALKNSNASVRTSATKTLITVKLFAGAGIKLFLEDINPQLFATIESEFDKVEGTPAPNPTRTSVDIAAMAPASSDGTTKGSLDPLEELFPRVEIDSLLKGTTILADAKSDAWKSKKEALESLQAILDQGTNKRLKPGMGEIGQVLKARVVDTNKVVQTLALDIVARIAKGMGKPFEKQTKFFVVPVATVLSDQKAPIRAAALQTLTAIANACEGLEPMIHFLGTALEATNPTQRASLLGWITEYMKEHPSSHALDLSSWVSTVVTCLDDRNADIRKGAQALLPALITSVGFDKVMSHTNGLKPASRKTAVPLIQAAKDLISYTNTARSSYMNPSTPPPASSGVPGKATGVRRKLPQGTSRPDSRAESVEDQVSTRVSNKSGLKRPGIHGAPPKVSTPPSNPRKWINESGPTRKDLADLLQHQMDPHTSKDLVALLFSHDHNAVNDHVAGLSIMYDFFSAAESGSEKYGAPAEDMHVVGLACSDLALKYVSIKIHEPQSNLVSRCLDVVEAVISFLRSLDAQIDDSEALCFVPTLIYKLGDAREPVRIRVQKIIQGLSKIYAYSRIFDLLLEHGLRSKVAKTRQGALDEIANLLKRNGIGACHQPSKAFPVIGSTIADKDSAVRKSALTVLSEAYAIVGEKVWNLIGPLPPKDKTQLEERLRRVPGPSSPTKSEPQIAAPPAQVARLTNAHSRPESPSGKSGGIPRPASPATSTISRIAKSSSPVRTLRSASPAPSHVDRPVSPARVSKLPGPATFSGLPGPSALSGSSLPNVTSPLAPRQKSIDLTYQPSNLALRNCLKKSPSFHTLTPPNSRGIAIDALADTAPSYDDEIPAVANDITITISSILSSDASRSEHTEGLIETITLQMSHVFERQEDLVIDENFRLAKHLIQTLNTFCDHVILAESLTIDILIPLLEELTLRLLETDDSHISKVKDMSRFINMIILRLFATGRKMSIFRALFSLLLQIVKPFPSSGTLPESKEARVAELVLKCVWKLARNIPQDLKEQKLDPVELLPAVEHFLQSVPPNEWRARATNKVPCGDMPLRTIKVVIQHIVAHYGDDVYDILSASFDDPSATIVYPYVYRILNSVPKPTEPAVRPQHSPTGTLSRPYSVASSRPISPSGSASAANRHSPPGHGTSASVSSHNGFSPPMEEPDPEAQLITIINHISSETTGAMHKEGITELHHFLKNYPHKRPRVEKLLETTGPAFRKYINRALASRAAEDLERSAAVASTLSKLEANGHDSQPTSPVTREGGGSRPTPPSVPDAPGEDRLHQLHDIFHYKRSSTTSNGSARRMSET